MSVTQALRREIKETYFLSVPLVAAQLVYASSSFIGTALVAKLGQNALAASVLVSMIWLSLSVFFFGLLNAVSVLISHQFGARNYAVISTIMGQAYFLGAIFCLVIIAILLSMPLFLHWSHQPAAVLKLAYEYMYSLIWTTPGLIILIIHEQFLAGIGKTKLVLRISLWVVPIEIPLIYLFIFGKLGFPAFGVAGIGYGFAVTYTVTAIWMTYYLLTSPYYKKYAIFSQITQLHWGYIREFLRVGMPMGIMHIIEVSTFALATFWIARFGTTLLAAHQIVIQYLNFIVTMVFAVSQAVTVRVGHAIGRLDLQAIRYASCVGIILNSGLMLLIACSFYLIPTFFLRLDINVHDLTQQTLVHDASLLLFISGILLLFDNFRIIGFGALRSLKDTRFSLLSSFFGFWIVGLSAAFLFTFCWHWQKTGIWWGLTLGVASSALIICLRLYYQLTHLTVEKLTIIKKV